MNFKFDIDGIESDLAFLSLSQKEKYFEELHEIIDKLKNELNKDFLKTLLEVAKKMQKIKYKVNEINYPEDKIKYTHNDNIRDLSPYKGREFYYYFLEEKFF